MALTDSKGGVPAKKHKLHKSNIEMEENEASADRLKDAEAGRFPRHTHKPGGLVREVTNEEELADALKKGWAYDIREVMALEPAEAPTRISQMTVPQAKAFIAEHADDVTKLVEIRGDETTYGNRAEVLKALAEAEDNVGTPKAPKAPAAPKTAKTAKKK